MADGSLGTISVTLGSAAPLSRHRFTFRNLSAESNPEPYANAADPWTFTVPEGSTDVAVEHALTGFTPVQESYEGQFRQFYRSLIRGELPPVTLNDARQVLELIGAAYASAESGSSVTLPLAKNHPRYARL